MKYNFNTLGYRLAALTIGGALLIGAVAAFTGNPQTAKTAGAHKLEIPVDERPLARDGEGVSSYSPVVKKVAPAVVQVFTTARVQRMSSADGTGMDDMLRRFFGEQFDGRNPNRDQRRSFGAPRQQGVGSGVIATKDGYILTNNHVVENAEEVKVALPDGREFSAKVVGRDPKTDIAVLKIDAKNLPVVTMADSDHVEVGDVVLAVGNPFGIGQTVTKGIVSATGRGNMGLDYEDFIQTDAAINPGNSGGALVDAEGRLIGINTAILSRSGGNQGIGFAIPANLVRNVMQDLLDDGHVTRGFLGVMIQDLNPALAREFNLKEAKGVLVSDVTPGSPAEKAGLKGGDVILEFDGKQVSTSRHLKLEVAQTKPGQTVPVRILRDGDSKTVQVAIKPLPGSEAVAKADGVENPDSGTLNGVGVTDLDNRARQQFNVPAAVRGAVITEVDPNSAAAEAGLRPGDVIQEINRKPVRNAEEAIAMTERNGNKRSLVRVWRDGGSRYVVVDESKAG
jgi:serine protease Do